MKNFLRFLLILFNILFFLGGIISNGEKNITYPTEISINNPLLFMILAIVNIVSLFLSDKGLPILKSQLLLIGFSFTSIVVAILFILGELPIINTNKIFALVIFSISGVFNFVMFTSILWELIPPKNKMEN
jgi:hypothetical protein